LSLFTITILIVYFFFSFENSDLKTFPVNELENGDLIFRRGKSAESQAVIIADRRSEFSHVGIIYIEKRTPFVIHAVPGENEGRKDYIKKEKLSDFLAPEKASKYSVFRSNFPKPINETAASVANRYYQDKRQFDNKFDLSTNDKLYCTELIMKAYQQASNQPFKFSTTHLNIIFGTIDIILPGNIIENKHFHQIINN